MLLIRVTENEVQQTWFQLKKILSTIQVGICNYRKFIRNLNPEQKAVLGLGLIRRPSSFKSTPINWEICSYNSSWVTKHWDPISRRLSPFCYYQLFNASLPTNSWCRMGFSCIKTNLELQYNWREALGAYMSVSVTSKCVFGNNLARWHQALQSGKKGSVISQGNIVKAQLLSSVPN